MIDRSFHEFVHFSLLQLLMFKSHLPNIQSCHASYVLCAELFHTERNHVRNFKVMKYIFNVPMDLQPWIAPELVRLLFPNLDQMITVHGQYGPAMYLSCSTSYFRPQFVVFGLKVL